MLASRLHASSTHDVTASSPQLRLAAAASSTRRHSVLMTKKDSVPFKDCKSHFASKKWLFRCKG